MKLIWRGILNTVCWKENLNILSKNDAGEEIANG